MTFLFSVSHDNIYIGCWATECGKTGSAFAKCFQNPDSDILVTKWEWFNCLIVPQEETWHLEYLPSSWERGYQRLAHCKAIFSARQPPRRKAPPWGAACQNGVLMAPLTCSCGSLHKSPQMTLGTNTTDCRQEVHLSFQLKMWHIFRETPTHGLACSCTASVQAMNCGTEIPVLEQELCGVVLFCLALKLFSTDHNTGLMLFKCLVSKALSSASSQGQHYKSLNRYWSTRAQFNRQKFEEIFQCLLLWNLYHKVWNTEEKTVNLWWRVL